MSIHSSYGRQKLDDDYCFLCGKYLIETGSVEHVFPKWLLNKYTLWNQKIDLLNLSSLPYRQLTIPCCKECNNEHLSRVESQVSEKVKDGFEGARKIPENIWYLWVAKIFYGILRKEISLSTDRANLQKGNILPEEVLSSFESLHLFLQAFRGKHLFNGDVPYTILICNLHDIGTKFDFRDSLLHSTVALKLGDVGIIASLEDGGLVKGTFGKYVSEVDERKLHPIQFLELFTKVVYQVKLLKTPLNYITETHLDGEKVAITHIVDSPMYVEKWNQEEFSHLLNLHITRSQWGQNGWQVKYSAPDLVSTWMSDGSGEIILLTLEEWKQSNTNEKTINQ